jgi:hypothetical protein
MPTREISILHPQGPLPDRSPEFTTVPFPHFIFFILTVKSDHGYQTMHTDLVTSDEVQRIDSFIDYLLFFVKVPLAQGQYFFIRCFFLFVFWYFVYEYWFS